MININEKTIRSYVEKIYQRKESTSLIIKKLNIVDKFLNWAYQNNLIKENNFKQLINEIDNINSKIKSSSDLKFNQDLKIEDKKLEQNPILITESQKQNSLIYNFDKNISQEEKINKDNYRKIFLNFNLLTYKIKSFIYNLIKSPSLLNEKNTSKEIKKKEKEQNFDNNFNLYDFRIYHYIGLIFFLVFLSFVGSSIYNKYFIKTDRTLAYPLKLNSSGGRILSFQGRLTDSLGNPITKSTNVKFNFYNVKTGGTPLFTAGPCSIMPNKNGIFSTLIGSSCGSEIPHSIFNENANIYVGITVASDSEMTPRQLIANVGYAINAKTLEGFTVGKNLNNIPFINQDGHLIIAVDSPGIHSIYESSDFIISSAKTTFIQSSGNGDVVLQATESGVLKFRTAGNNDIYTRMIIDNTGNVGIGTNNPNVPLEVAGEIQSERLIDRDNISYGIDPAGNTLKNNSSLYIAHGAILSDISGNVGIGTSNPQEKLVVKGGRTILNTQNNSGSNTRNFGPMLFTDNLFGMELGHNGSLFTTRILARDNDGGIEFGKYPTGNTTNVNHFSPWMTIINNGNVGVGTTNPGTKLSVAGLTGTASFNLLRYDTSTGNLYFDASTIKNKENTQSFITDFSRLLKIETKSFIDKTSKKQEIGLIAEDLDALGLKELVVYDKKGKITGVHYEKVPLYILEISKIHHKQLEILKNRVLYLEKEFNIASNGEIKITKTEENSEYIYSGIDFKTKKSKIKSQNYNLKNKTEELIERIGVFAEIFSAKIQTGLLEAQDTIVNNVLVAKKIFAENIEGLILNVENLTTSQKVISPVLTTEEIELKNQNSKIKTKAEDAKLSIVDKENNPVVEFQTDEKKTNINGYLEINSNKEKGKLAQIILKNLEGKSAVIVDASGNASFSGTLNTQQISTNLVNTNTIISNDINTQNATISENLSTNNLNASEASISGKLVAKEVEAENINEIQKLLADIKNQPLPNLNNQTNLSNTTDLNEFQQISSNFNSITVTGQSNLYNVSVSGSLLVGSTIIENNSVIALASELKLLALDKITLFDDKVTITKDGKISTKGTLIAQGGIQTSTITPIEKEVSILGNLNILGNFSIPRATNSAVIAASENFTKNGIFAPAIESSNSIAGTGIIPKNSQEVIIYSSFAKPDSLIYLTPKTNQPISLSVYDKKDGFFRIIRNQLLDQDVMVDWLIIN